MRYIVVYDVPSTDDPLRRKIATACKNYGLLRLQYSMFWGNLSKAEVRALAFECRDLIGDTPTDIRFIAVCNACCDRSFAIVNNIKITEKDPIKILANPLMNIITHTTVGWRPGDNVGLGKKRKKKKKKDRQINRERTTDPVPESFYHFSSYEEVANFTNLQEMKELTEGDLSPPTKEYQLPDFDSIFNRSEESQEETELQEEKDQPKENNKQEEFQDINFQGEANEKNQNGIKKIGYNGWCAQIVDSLEEIEIPIGGEVMKISPEETKILAEMNFLSQVQNNSQFTKNNSKSSNQKAVSSEASAKKSKSSKPATVIIKQNFRKNKQKRSNNSIEDVDLIVF
jgi:CRISPR-associated protein Cas2